jgi:hypothetical protein
MHISYTTSILLFALQFLMSDLLRSIGATIRRHRESHGSSLEDLASRCALSPRLRIFDDKPTRGSRQRWMQLAVLHKVRQVSDPRASHARVGSLKCRRATVFPDRFVDWVARKVMRLG